MDARSVGSTGSASASNRKVDCPFCNQEFQNRTIFNHIQKKHWREFIDHIFIKDEEELQEHIDHARGLPLMWNVKTDFDETEPVEINGCLACGTGIPTKSAAAAHCSKDKCREKHVKLLKSLMPDIKRKQKRLEEEETKRNRDNWSEDQLVQELTLFMRWYKYMVPRVERLVESYNTYIREVGYTNKKPCNWVPEEVPKSVDLANVRDQYRKWCRLTGRLSDMIETLREEQFHNLKLNFDMWLARTPENPSAHFVTLNSLSSPEFVDLYPAL